MNRNMENLLGCFYRIMYDRGKELDRNNGGSRELEDVGICEHDGGIENRNLQNKFDYEFQGLSMASEASHQPFMVDLNMICDSNASHQHANNRSANLEAKIQALQNLVNRSQRDEGTRNLNSFATCDDMREKFHGGNDKLEVQLFGFEVNSLKNYYEYSVLGNDMTEVETNEVLGETEEVLIEAEVILVDEELGNASKGMKCGAANEINGTEVGAGDSFVPSNRNGDVTGDKHAQEVFLCKLVYNREDRPHEAASRHSNSWL